MVQNILHLSCLILHLWGSHPQPQHLLGAPTLPELLGTWVSARHFKLRSFKMALTVVSSVSSSHPFPVFSVSRNDPTIQLLKPDPDESPSPSLPASCPLGIHPQVLSVLPAKQLPKPSLSVLHLHLPSLIGHLLSHGPLQESPISTSHLLPLVCPSLCSQNNLVKTTHQIM